MRKYLDASYNDLVEAAFIVLKSYDFIDQLRINTKYKCRVNHRYKDWYEFDELRQLAEMVIASLEDYELSLLMGQGKKRIKAKIQ